MAIYSISVLCPGILINLPRPDVIVGSSVHPFAAWAAQILAGRYGVPFIFEVRDLWPQTLIVMGRIKKNGTQAKFLRWLENRLYQRAAKIIILMPNAKAYISRYRIDEERIEWIPNGVNIQGERQEITYSERYSIMYLGAHGKANALDVILEAIYLLKDDEIGSNIDFRFIGEGDSKKELIRKSKELGLTNISFENGVPKSDVFKVMSEANALVISVKNLPKLYEYGVSMNKIYEYMLAGRPIVIAIDTFNNPVEEARAGIFVKPESPEDLASAIRKLVTLPKAELDAYGINGRKHVEEFYDYNHLARKYLNVLNEMT